ncbi:hypothetical protein [Cohnella panacarvi]|uniref:hypothetical protein n=1 Tax=Cohnella panacarvi TaxID=400776 RepID=UPI00047C929A|nr:hypothetical protein [Cohnella panacarvi]
MYWKRYAVFVLLLACSVALDTAIDSALGIGAYHMALNVRFVYVMMEPSERLLLVVLMLLFVRKPLAKGISALFGGGKRSGGNVSAQPSNPSDEQ